MGWFTKPTESHEQAPLPDLWHVCPACQAHVFKDEWEGALKVCPKCGHHDRLSARERIGLLVDPGTFREFGTEILPSDPLSFSDAKGPYAAKAAAAVKKLGTSESVVVGSGNVEGTRVVLAVMDFRFLGGSLSTGCGEKIALAIQHAIDFNRAFPRPAPRSSASKRPACPTSRSSPTPPRAASPRATRSSATSTSPSPGRSSASPAAASSRRRSSRSSPTTSRPPNTSSSTGSSTPSSRARSSRPASRSCSRSA